MSVENLYPQGLLFDDPETLDQEPSEPSFPYDAAVIYQREIKDLPIMDPITSRQLADLIQDGQFSQEVIELLEFIEIPKEGEVLQIQARADAGPIAEQQLVVGYLRFAAHVARLSMGWVPFGYEESNQNGESVFHGARLRDLRFSDSALPLADRIQAANLGLMRAAKKYRSDGGANFTTFAMYDLEQQLARSVAYDRNIKLPIDVVMALRKVTRQPEKLTKSTFPSVDLVESWEPAEHKLRYIRDISQTASLEDLSERHETSNDDVTADDEPRPAFIETLEDRDNDDENKVFDKMQAESIRAAVQTLPDHERLVLELRYGLGGDEPMTLEDISNHPGLSSLRMTRDRVRQTEYSALARLTGLYLGDGFFGVEYAGGQSKLLTSVRRTATTAFES